VPTSTIHYQDFAHVGIDEVTRGGTIGGTDGGSTGGGTGSRVSLSPMRSDQWLGVLDAYFGLREDQLGLSLM
jgi:hypothetical protein